MDLEEVIGSFGALCFVGLIGFAFNDLLRNERKEEEFYHKYNKVCQTIEKSFDINNNGALDFEEGVELSKVLGIQETYPGTDLMFDLKPGNIGMIDLGVYSDGNFVNSGLFSGSGRPAFYEIHSIPVSKAEQLASQLSG